MYVDKNQIVYAGFWVRFCAMLIDLLFVAVISGFVSNMVFPEDSVSHWNWICDEYGDCDLEFYHGGHETTPLLFVLILSIYKLLFWHFKSATPGKIMMRLVIVDSRTGETPSTRQFIGRYLCYLLSAIPLMLGFLWVGFDQRKSGWHDKLSHTAVVRARLRLPSEDFI